MALPPPPAGFAPEPDTSPDPLAAARSWGAQITSGYRTPEHNAAVGGVPDSFHQNADALDLLPGSSGLSMGQLRARALDLARRWHGARVINEGDHIHAQFPGWGGAPGVPTPPAGFAPAPAAPLLPPSVAAALPFLNKGLPSLMSSTAASAAPPAAIPSAAEQADAAAFLGKPSGIVPPLSGPLNMGPRPTLQPQAPPFSPPRMTPAGAGLIPSDARPGQAVESVAPLPNGESYRGTVDPKANAQLQAAFDGVPGPDGVRRGASVKQLVDMATGLGIQFEHGSLTALRDAVNYRDKGGKGARIAPEDMHAPAPGPRPGEVPSDYYRRMSGGQSFDGPITPDHPMGRTVRERTEKLFRDMGYQDAPERADVAGLLPIVGGGYAWDEAKRDFRTHHYGSAAVQTAMAGIGILPIGPGGEVKAGVHVIDSAALRAAAAAGEGGVDMAKAGAVLRSSVDDALSQGGTVMLHIEGKPREIVGTSEGGLVDAKGQTWGSMPLLSPAPGDPARLELHIPHAADRAPGVPGEALASDLPQEAPNEAARLGGGAPAAKPSNVSHFTIHDPVGGDGSETVKFVLRPNGDSFIQRADDVIDTSAMTRAGFTPEQTIATHLGEDTSGRNVVAAAAPEARQRDYLNIPSLPRDYRLDLPGEQSGLGFTGRMNETRSPEEMAALARGAQPEAFAPPSSRLIRTEAEAMRANPDTLRAIEPPAAVTGRVPARPNTFADAVKARLQAESKAKGMPVRIDAEEAIDKGVPADLVYQNPGVVDRSQLRLRLPSIFGTRFGKMTSKQQHLISLDMGDVDPLAWGFDHKVGQRLDPEDIGDLLGRSLQGDDSALERGPRFDAWTAHNEAEAQRAEFEGRFPDGPPVEQVGSPATLADLRASEPPATSYEDLLSSGRQRVANINLDNIHTQADIQRALEATEAHFGGFDAARRVGQGHAETAALADETGMTADDLLRRRHGQALNAEQALRARQILAKSLDELGTMAADIERQGGIEAVSAEARADWHAAVLRHAAIYEQVTGATSEAGRALESFKIGAGSKAVHGTIHALTAAGGRGAAKLDDIAKMIVDLHKAGVGPGGINRFAAEAVKPATPVDMLLELFYNSILSAPSTHAINMLGNTVSTAMSVPEYGLAALLGKLRGGPDRVMGAEVSGYVDGLLHGVGKGSDAFMTALKTSEAGDSATKFDVVRHRAIPGLAGKIIRTPTRFLVAEDEFFKGIARQGAIGRLAARQAAKEGLTGQAFAARVAELRANPTDAIQNGAREFARYMTFQREPGRLGKALQGWTDDYPVLKFLVPFIRTQENLVKFAAERSPLAFLMPTVRADIRAGGAKRDLALAKIAIGSAVGLGAYEAASHGLITGGEPMDAGTRNLLHDAGWQPYSIKVGGRYVSYRRLDPLSLGISVAADLATYDKYMTPAEREKGWTILAQMTSRNMASSFWMESVGNIFDLVANPGKEAPRQLASIVGALAVPNIIAQPTASMDSVERIQTPDPQAGALAKVFETILNRVKGRIPGLRQTLPARLDAFGVPVRNDGRLGPDILSPFPQRLANPDPSYQALIDNGLRVDVPGKTVNRTLLTAKQHGDYTRLSGEYVRKDLADAMRDPAWATADPSARHDWFEQIKRDARADARADLKLDSLGDEAPPPPPPPGVKAALDAAALAAAARAAAKAAPRPAPGATVPKVNAPPAPPPGFVPAPPAGFQPVSH